LSSRKAPSSQRLTVGSTLVFVLRDDLSALLSEASARVDALAGDVSFWRDARVLLSQIEDPRAAELAERVQPLSKRARFMIVDGGRSYRVDSDGDLVLCDGETEYRLAQSGKVLFGPPRRPPLLTDPLLDPEWLLDFELGEPTPARFNGRAVVLLEAQLDSSAGAPVASVEALVDMELGFLHRFVKARNGVPFERQELSNLDFQPVIDPAVFVPELRPGVELVSTEERDARLFAASSHPRRPVCTLGGRECLVVYPGWLFDHHCPRPVAWQATTRGREQQYACERHVRLLRPRRGSPEPVAVALEAPRDRRATAQHRRYRQSRSVRRVLELVVFAMILWVVIAGLPAWWGIAVAILCAAVGVWILRLAVSSVRLGVVGFDRQMRARRLKWAPSGSQ
jgi:hypothetical protein